MTWNGDVRRRSDMHLNGAAVLPPETHLQHLHEAGMLAAAE